MAAWDFLGHRQLRLEGLRSIHADSKHLAGRTKGPWVRRVLPNGARTGKIGGQKIHVP